MTTTDTRKAISASCSKCKRVTRHDLGSMGAGSVIERCRTCRTWHGACGDFISGLAA